ncbi:PAS domain-containing protein [Nitratireductor luteus]|uniref:PAS domain-containing protein n=1 Tax=Nitratireductor luteus TaxID=2976980 RepID=UPI002240CC85|nr:PAS domain-containing protein [Nitratireductor luteus]
MKQDGTLELFQYWNRLRGRRPAPQRTEIEPADIKSRLADTFILERDARGEPIFRLAGTRLCAMHGKELKGHSFTSLWSEWDHGLISRLSRNVFDDASVVVVSFHGTSHNQRTLELEMIILPLEGGSESPRALGAISPCEKPFWLGADPIVESRLESFRLIDPDREPLLLGNRPAIPSPSLSPDDKSLDSGPGAGTGRRIRHLVVFKGGKS